MSKIAFVGDIHFSGINPSSRKETREQYRQLLLDKMEAIRQICINQNVQHVIILGDVFNNNSGISNVFEVDIWHKFLEFKQVGIEVYTIIGNHDMAFQNETEFKGTYLYKAFLTGIIKHLDILKVGDATIKGIDFNYNFIATKDLKDCSSYNICVAHCFYENERFGGTGNGNLTYAKCEELGYNAYILGHDHMPYADIEEPLFKVIRPGSLVRGTSKTCNLYRKVNISLFDLDTHQFSLAEIPTKPGVEVFIEKVVLSKELDVNMNEIISNLDYSKHSDIYDIIDTHEESGKESLKEFYPEVISLITQYCESVGIYRKMSDDNDNKG